MRLDFWPTPCLLQCWRRRHPARCGESPPRCCENPLTVVGIQSVNSEQKGGLSTCYAPQERKSVFILRSFPNLKGPNWALFFLSTDLTFICFLIGDLSYWPMNGFVSPPHHMNLFGHCPWPYLFQLLTYIIHFLVLLTSSLKMEAGWSYETSYTWTKKSITCT